MRRSGKCRTVREALDSIRDPIEFNAFAKTLLSPPPGVKVKRPTPDELSEIKKRLEKDKLR